MTTKTASILLAALSVLLVGTGVLLYFFPLAGPMTGNLLEAAAGGTIGTLGMLVLLNVR